MRGHWTSCGEVVLKCEAKMGRTMLASQSGGISEVQPALATPLWSKRTGVSDII